MLHCLDLDLFRRRTVSIWACLNVALFGSVCVLAGHCLDLRLSRRRIVWICAFLGGALSGFELV